MKWRMEWQDSSELGKSPAVNFAGASDFSDLSLALVTSYIEWRRTDYRHVRVIDETQRLVVQWFPRKDYRR